MRRTVRTSGRAEPEILGRLLRALREKAGLSQREVATQLQRSHSFVGRVESGSLQLDLPTLFDLADIFAADPLSIVKQVREEALSGKLKEPD